MTPPTNFSDFETHSNSIFNNNIEVEVAKMKIKKNNKLEGGVRQTSVICNLNEINRI